MNFKKALGMAKLQQVSRQQLFRTVFEISPIRSLATAAISEATLAAAKPFEQIPGFKVLPIFGTSWVFWPLIGKYSITNGIQYDNAKYEKFGSISKDMFGSFKLVSIHDPQDIETLFRNEALYPTRTDFSSLRAYRELRKDQFTTKGVLILQGKEWYDLRYKLQKSMLKTKLIEKYVEPMEEVARDFVKLIVRNRDHKNEVPEFMKQLVKWSSESVAYVGMNKRLGCLNVLPSEEGLEMIKNVQLGFALMNKLEALTGNIQFWKWFSTPTWRKYVRTMDFFSSIAFKYVNQAIEEVKNKVDTVEEEDMTMVQSMLATNGLDVHSVVTMIVDMVLAGVDSTSNTLGFLLYTLAKNPEKQEKLHHHITRLMPNPTDRINAEILRKMTYLKYCIKETQRLHSITRLLVRTLEEDIVLSGYRIPAGITIMCPLDVTHHQEKYYENANKYVPERWMEGENKPHPFAFLPFGFGSRSCIGRRIAELELQCAAIEIIRNFKVEYHYEDIGMETRLVNVADRPFKLTFCDRKG